uniref:Uncharacterized protein n=1 Tax=Anguilla anguilla TaxID=7936 RepID=A0A0E9RUW0_ANGAN
MVTHPLSLKGPASWTPSRP